MPSSVERKKYENQPQGMKVRRLYLQPTTIIILIVLINSNVIALYIIINLTDNQST